jgi:F-type H+-transporting ATPase subunit b
MSQTVKGQTAVPQDAAHGRAFPPLNPDTFPSQLLWLALTFALLYVFLARVVLPRIGGVMHDRRERIRRDLERAERLKAETEQALAAYEQALAEARAKANALAKETREKLAASIEKERAKVETRIARKLEEAEARIAKSKSKALSSVNEIAAEIAGAIVAKLTGTEVSKDEVQRALMKRAAE